MPLITPPLAENDFLRMQALEGMSYNDLEDGQFLLFPHIYNTFSTVYTGRENRDLVSSSSHRLWRFCHFTCNSRVLVHKLTRIQVSYRSRSVSERYGRQISSPPASSPYKLFEIFFTIS